MNNETQREDDLIRLYFKKSTPEARQAQFEALVASGADPDVLARRIASKVAEEQQRRKSLSSRRLFVAISIILLIAILAIFLFVQPMKEMTRSAAVAWLASPTPIGTITGTPTLTPTIGATLTPTVTITLTSTPTPTPTVEVTTWTFTGRVTRYGADEGLPDTQVLLTVRLSGGQEEVIPITMDDSGDFVGEFESTGMVEAAIARITPPTASWQIRLANGSPWTQDSTDPTLFSTAVTGTEVPSLDLEAVVSRRFSGQVALSTFPEGTDAAGVAGIQLGIEESEDGQNWQIASCGQTPDAQAAFLLDDQGSFDLTCESGNGQAYYRLRPTLPTMYQASALNVQPSGQWSMDEEGWITNEALPNGEFSELSLLYQLHSITLLVTCADCLELAPDSTSWSLSSYPNKDEEGGEYEAYTAFINTDNASLFNSTWTVFLPTGDYYLEMWTPDGMSTPVRYEVQMTLGTAGASADDGIYISNQKNRKGVWWDFVATDIQPSYPITSVGEVVKVFVSPFTTDTSMPYDDTTMAVGPIRIVVEPATAPTLTPSPTSNSPDTPTPPIESPTETPATSTPETPTPEPLPTP